MSDYMDYRQLIYDFVVGDRRLADRSDIQIDTETLPDWIEFRERRDQRGVPVELVVGKNKFRLQTGRLSQPEINILNHLPPLLCYVELIDSPVMRSESVKARIAAYSYNSLHNLLPVEEGGREEFPVGRQFFAACYAGGIFCPPSTALVRAINISPAMLAVLKENPAELRRLSPDQFEYFVANRLERMGYEVSLTGPTTHRDGGIDIIAVPKIRNVGSSFVLAAQVKHHEGEQKTGRDAVDRMASWNGPFRLGMLVTNTAFTRDAVWSAAQERNRDFIRLRDFTDLKRWLQDQYGTPEDWREIPDQIELAPGIVVRIPKPKLYVPSEGVIQSDSPPSNE
jgi:hypothetical protein